MSPISTPRCHGPRAAPAPPAARSRSGRSGPSRVRVPRARIRKMAAVSATAEATAEAVARRSYGKLVAFLAARTSDVAGAEDALSDAFAAALANWPRNGVPERPEAWLVAVARRKLIDQSRKRRTRHEAAGALGLISEELQA